MVHRTVGRTGWPRWTLVSAVVGICAVGTHSVVFAQAAKLEQLVEPLGSGSVNWSTGWVKSTGLGAPPANMSGAAGQAMAQRAGFAVAIRNLLETVKGIRVDSATLVENYMIQNDVIKSEVSGYVKGAQIAKTNPLPDGSVEVTVKVQMYGVDSLMTPFLPEKGITSKDLPPEPAQEGYTGLVIDARGLGAKPACFPSVLDDKGEVVFGPQTVDRASAEKEGMVHYMTASKGADLSSLFGEQAVIVRPVQTAAPMAREGRKPLKIKGANKAGALKANVLISAEDAKKIREDSQLGTALKRSRVVIVTDPLVGGMEGRLPASEGLLAAVIPVTTR